MERNMLAGSLEVWWRVAQRGAVGALLAGLSACAAASAGSHAPALAPATIALESRKERSARRLENFHTRLHPMARALVRGQDNELGWLRDGFVVLPSASCAAATQWTPPAELECSMVGLDDGALAVLVMRETGASRDEPCVEHSWVFLRGFAWPLSLPAPRVADYRRLRAELSKEDATALWLAGFRGAGDPRRADVAANADESLAAAGDLPAPLSSYQSCTLAPDQRELVCRATTGDVIGLDPLRGARRLIARLGLEQASRQDLHKPVSFTPDGRLTLRVRARAHRLCGGGTCELVARVSLRGEEPARAQWLRAVPAARY
jgi:hypothetical protein